MKNIKQLKKQQKIGGTPNRPVQPIVSPVTDAATNTATVPLVEVQKLARALADQIIAERDQSQLLSRNGRVFTKFDPINDIIDNQNETVTAGVWSDNLASLTTYFTASDQTNSQRQYYVDTYQKDPAATGSAVQFSVAYGNALGSGSDSAGVGANIA